MMHKWTPMQQLQFAEQFAAVALRNVVREFPSFTGQVISRKEDLKTARELHPIFYGCYDWHSAVHAHWLLARLCRWMPGLRLIPEIESHFDHFLTPANVDAELQYFLKPQGRSFERPYGWGWLLALANELKQHSTPAWKHRHAALLPLTDLIAGRWAEFLPLAVYPVRSGTHSNLAFALALTHEYALSHADHRLQSLIVQKATEWFAADQNASAWEPSLDDFLSPTLQETNLLRQIWPRDRFMAWLDLFLPRLGEKQPASLFSPAVVPDRRDGKITHLDGLNLSRAWCWRELAETLGENDPRCALMRHTASEHFAASIEHITGNYAGEHWLATFAMLAITGL